MSIFVLFLEIHCTCNEYCSLVLLSLKIYLIECMYYWLMFCLLSFILFDTYSFTLTLPGHKIKLYSVIMFRFLNLSNVFAMPNCLDSTKKYSKPPTKTLTGAQVQFLCILH